MLNISKSQDQLNLIDCAQSNLSMPELAAYSMDQLNSTGYLILRNFDVDEKNVVDAGEKFLQFSQLLGEPISHDTKNSIIWDIKTNPSSKSQIKTYSEHSSEAEMHTDSQYSDKPEHYFGLLTLHKADCGGGESMLLSLEDILLELRKVDVDGKHETVLRDTRFPFIVPNVFRKIGEAKAEYNFGPILRDNEIRFRVDTFEKAILASPDLCSEEQLNAYRVLKDIVLNSKFIKTLYLEARDLILMNNRTMLHGRTEFSDNKRHLLRIRFNAK